MMATLRAEVRTRKQELRGGGSHQLQRCYGRHFHSRPEDAHQYVDARSFVYVETVDQATSGVHRIVR